MGKNKKGKLKGKALAQLGYTNTTTRSLAMQIVGKVCKHNTLEEKLAFLAAIIQQPEQYKTHKDFAPIAHQLLDSKQEEEQYEFKDKPFEIYGRSGIPSNAITQMENAMRLPIVADGALMPDAHYGYGLPIGGVLATEAVIPYGVGMDIGCRMSLSIFEAKANFIEKNSLLLKKILQDNARFGKAIFEDNKRDDILFDRPEFNSFGLLRRLRDKAYSQIGSSGGGNHFVEFGTLQIKEPTNEFGLAEGNYLALLTHSGSRGFGATIANTYTKIAMKKRNLPKQVAHLAWLNMNEQEGQEYWLAMNLAGTMLLLVIIIFTKGLPML
jgi:tRNA-splicing ligase RtcB